jgi:hypothetical protein
VKSRRNDVEPRGKQTMRSEEGRSGRSLENAYQVDRDEDQCATLVIGAKS